VARPSPSGLTLGIHDGHGAGAALAHDGRVLAAVSEERLTRRKRERGFPRLSIAACLSISGATPDDVEQVVYATRWGRAGTRLFDGRYRRGDEGGGPLALAARLEARLENGSARLPGWRAFEASVGRAALVRRLGEHSGVRRARVDAMEHHQAHSLAAAFGAGFGGQREPRSRDSATAELVVTLDGFGDGLAGSVSEVVREGSGDARLRRIAELPWTQSLGLVYGAVCHALGFAEGEEGQVTALAASGDPGPFAALLASVIRIPEPCDELRGPHEAFTVDRKQLAGPLRRAVGNAEPSDVARALQDRVEAAAARWVRSAIAPFTTGSRTLRVACAGGLFANVRLAPRLKRLPQIEEVQVFPAMSDDGLCVGAALGGRGLGGRPQQHGGVYYGPDIHPREAADSLARAGLTPEPPCDVAAAVARAIASGLTVAVVAGRMEFGPRALGHRSLLFDARRPELAVHVGRALRRPPHMPFAPAVLAGELPRCLEAPAGLERTAEHMTVALGTTPWMQERYPAAVHVDGTARVQAVDSERAPRMARILEALRTSTGHGVAMNTSFNLHGEPIVASAEDAVRTFRASGVDLMLLGDLLVRRAGEPG